jgi:SNF2 family DNA or RNA helicase
MFTGTLKPYQTESVDRMVDTEKMLVAFEMGTGKTVMTICAIENLDVKHTLVVCLSSLKYQWKKEIEKFSDSKALVIDGTPKQRNGQYLQMKDYDYVIVNYEQVVNDWDSIKSFKWNAIVCDEATAIKGFRSKRAKKVKELSKTIPIRFALTGTPIENGRPEELYSIMEFVDPKLLGRFDLFDRTFIVRNQFGGVQRYRNLPVFHEKMKEASVRKTQSDPDVAPYLPSEIYRDPVFVKLDPKGSALYNTISEELLVDLIDAQQLLGTGFSLAAHYGQEHKPGSPEDSLRGSIMSKVTAIRMLCDHPELLEISAKNFKENYDSAKNLGGSQYAYSLYERGLLDGTKKSPKLEKLVEYVKDHLETDPDAKVVIFTSYVGMVKMIHDRVGGVMYTGQMDAKQKEVQKEKFLSDPDCRIFISSDAGGYGVDLPVANLLVNYDLPWSAGLAVQRNGRIKRASSRWPSITIQDILIKNSIESRQWEMLQQKNAVSSAIIDGEGINDKGGVDLTVGSLISFIQEQKP